MVTLADTRARVADMLMRSDLNSQIDAEITQACKEYARKITWLTETRGGTLATVADQQWYGSFNLSVATAIQSVTGRTSVNFTDVQRIVAMVDADGNPLQHVLYSELLAEDPSTRQTPEKFTAYGGSVGFWPVPNGVQTITITAVVKPVAPVAGTDTSVFLDNCERLIESAAAASVAAKFIRDMETAAMFAALEQAAYQDIVAEGMRKQSGGKLKAHY